MLVDPFLPLRRVEARPPSNADRPRGIARAGRVVQIRRCEVRMDARELRVDGVPRALQPRPFDLLVYLIEHRDRVVTHAELLAEVWNDAPVQACSLPAAIMRLRKALDDERQEIVRTYQRVGYRLVAPLEFGPSPAARQGRDDPRAPWRAVVKPLHALRSPAYVNS